MDMVSVIIPVYNTEVYLDKCIESVVLQTYKNLEILLVDDGSTDGSLEICNKWAKKDARIVVLSKSNGGQGSARNMALNVLKGQYVTFVDSDDWINKDMIHILYHNIKKYGADVSCCNNGKPDDVDSKCVSVFHQPEIMWEHLQNRKGTGHSPCDKMFDFKLFNDVRFTELRAYEDCATIYRLLHKAEKVVWQDITLYYYISRPESTMTSGFSKRKYHMITAYLQMYNDYMNWHPEFAFKVKEYLIGSLQFCIGETLTSQKSKEYQEDYTRAINIARTITLKDVKTKQKISLFLIKHIRVLYGVLYKILKKM